MLPACTGLGMSFGRTSRRCGPVVGIHSSVEFLEEIMKTRTTAVEIPYPAKIVITAALTALIGCAGQTGPQGEPGTDGPGPECFATPTFGPESLYAGTDGTLYVSSV